MNIILDTRSKETVKIYFEQSQKPDIKAMLPQKAQSIEEALNDYEKTLLPSSTSFGQIIKTDGRYVGDIWCYCINVNDTPNAMLSFCIFDSSVRNNGVATEATKLFLKTIQKKYELRSVGAFTYSDNYASQKVLEKCGFSLAEEFIEDGRKSKYYQYSFNDNRIDADS